MPKKRIYTAEQAEKHIKETFQPVMVENFFTSHLISKVDGESGYIASALTAKMGEQDSRIDFVMEPDLAEKFAMGILNNVKKLKGEH